jgi:uncharacterized protein YjbI with pentapeptide repeats
MTAADSSPADSPVDRPPVPPPTPESRGRRIGFSAGAALATTSIGLFIVSGFALFSGDSGVAQPVATVLGGAGVLGAGVLTFRSAHNTRISAERTAADSLAHAETELEHARTVAADESARHEKQLAEQAKTAERTHQREVVRDLRSRYTTCAEQLAHDSAAIRLAGVYALASLADDWQQQNERDEKQVAIDLLRAYLRTPNIHTPALIAAKLPDTGELEVRKTILLTLQKRSSAEASDPKSWNGFDCTITNADVSNMSLSTLDLSGADLSFSNLSRAKLTAANLSRANLAGANLAGANLAGADLSFSKLADANLEGAKLQGAKLAEANLPGADLSFSNLTDATLSGARLSEADLSFSNLSGAYLTNADLTSTDLTGTDLSCATLSGADLTHADLSRADLAYADLTGTNLSGMDLTGVNLTHAAMAGVVLTAATLVDANLMNAVLSEANLFGANLHAANLEGANIEGTNLANIYHTAATIWPQGFVPLPSRDRP